MFNRFAKIVTSANFSIYLIGLMAYFPFIVSHHHLPIPSFHGEWIAAALGLLALLPLLKRESWRPMYLPHIALIFAGFLAIVVIQTMLGMMQSVQYSLLVATYLAWAFLLVMLGNYLRHELGWEKIVSVLAWGMLAGAVTNVVFVVMQLTHRFGFAMSFMPNFSGYGAIGQLNHFANYIALGVASLIYLSLKKKLSFTVAFIISIFLLVMLAFSGSRSAWLYLVAFAVLAAIFRGISLKANNDSSALQLQQSKTLLKSALLLLPLFLIVQWALTLLSANVVSLPNDRLVNELGSLSGLGGSAAVGGIAMRLHVWVESLLLFMQSPWLGIGMGQTRWMSFITLDNAWSINMPGSYEHAHNLVIHLLAETGIAGAVLFVAGVFGWLRGFQWKNIRLEGWWLLAILSVIGIHSLLEYPLWYAYFLGITAFLLGAGDEKVKKTILAKGGQVCAQVFLAAFLLIGALFLLKNLTANAKLEYWVSQGVHQQISSSNQVAFYDDLNWVSDHSLLAPYVNVIYAIALQPNNKNLADKLWLSEAAMRFIPTKTTAYRYALLLELNGQHAEAIVYLKRALQSYPNAFKQELQKMPMQYWDLYLRMFSEAIAPIEKAEK